MTYHDVAAFAQTWGLVLLVTCFVAVMGFVFWPRNRERFRQASQLPFKED